MLSFSFISSDGRIPSASLFFLSVSFFSREKKERDTFSYLPLQLRGVEVDGALQAEEAGRDEEPYGGQLP